jgi:hypothetical protein
MHFAAMQISVAEHMWAELDAVLLDGGCYSNFKSNKLLT